MFFNLAKLNFYGGNYKFNITFASLKSTDNESNLDNTTSDNIKCIHDIRLVRSLKLQEMKISSNWPLIAVILFSWVVAFLEYCAQVPANRIGFIENGGPFTLMQLKIIQEVISLTVFTLMVTLMFRVFSGTISPHSSALSWLYSLYS